MKRFITELTSPLSVSKYTGREREVEVNISTAYKLQGLSSQQHISAPRRMYNYVLGHSPLGLFRTTVNKKKINGDRSVGYSIYKCSQEVELWAIENNISKQSERDLKLRPMDFKSGTLTN